MEDQKDEDSDRYSPPPLGPVEIEGYLDATKTRLFDSEVCEEIRHLMPPRLQLYDTWCLVYSLEQHGAALSTLYDRVRPAQGKRPGYVLAIKDTGGHLFGAYVNEHFHPIEGKRFYGNGECFLWKVHHTEEEDGEERHMRQFQAFPYTGLNEFMIFCTHKFLSMGGGDGHYGLWLDDSLDHGVTSRSLTFGNEPLTEDTKFRIIALEVWRVG
ncbi:oxidation resistance protein 1 [Trichomonascus vanleenenianus]|uniref:Oxr1p n=1 Tax=Trichomonascus vanleenenianus TaxID=2268995 RepID=UPI003ECB44BE